MDKEKIILAQKSQQEIDKLYIELCKVGDLDSIDYMLTSPDLKRRPKFGSVVLDVRPNGNKYYDGLIYAGENGHLELVDYLLFSPKIKDHEYYSDEDFDYLKLICDKGHFHIADFLLEKKIFDPQHVFVETYLRSKDVDNLAYYLITKCNIEITPDVQDIIDKNPKIADIFMKRELNQDLTENLGLSNQFNKKLKI